MEGGYLALDGFKAHVEFVFRQVLKGVVTEDVSGNELRGVGINGEIAFELVFTSLLRKGTTANG